MRRYFKAVLALFMVAFILFSSGLAAEPVKRSRAAVGFSLKDIKGRAHNLSDYKNKQAVVLAFWTTWCPFCRQELKSLNALYPQLQKEGIEVLAINIQEPGYRVESFAKENGLTMKMLLDFDAKVARDYSVMGVPTFFLVNKQGNIIYEGDHFPKEKYQKLISE
ncbi:MAG: TlpA disulfide reductase family protein [Candidatus Omnitrophica bacterium]|nr:TlpA disulfide reductase family protein [Candidatus Omnitrophota bacterium]